MNTVTTTLPDWHEPPAFDPWRDARAAARFCASEGLAVGLADPLASGVFPAAGINGEGDPAGLLP